jgi:glycosyltransferase involved in cell wall biosynthesis
VLLWLSAWVLAFTALCAFDTLGGIHRLGSLADVPPDIPASPPLVSVIVPARNEAYTIEPALRSILALDYVPLEVVVIDDRSEDGTGDILDRLAIEFPGLQVVHVPSLPEGWLGKNHALHLGAARARGEFLLFSDADVHYHPSALQRSVAFCIRRELDHLTVIPDFPVRSLLLQSGSVGGLLGLLMLFRPWKAHETGHHGLGIGAFNMVRAEAYRRAGGHAAIAMDVIDDIELGRLMGEHGRQDILFANGMVSVEIYRTVMEMLRGVQKNMFAFLRFNVWLLLAATLSTLLLQVWPWIGLFATDGAARWLNVSSIALGMAMHATLANRFGYSPAFLVFLPANGFVSIALFWQVAVATWIRGGIVWRGTLYPLAELKRRRRRR